MQYMGSKKRCAKGILPIILKNRKADQWYVEPFVGGFNMMDKVTGLRLASDSHPYLIALFQALQKGWQPPDFVSRDDYYAIKANPSDHPSELVGFVGFGCSFSGKWWGGYANHTYKGLPKNRTLEVKNGIMKQVKSLAGVDIRLSSYADLQMPSDDCVIYCDPPYEGTTGYKTGGFDHKAFWQWVRNQVSIGHQVFVSEYQAPQDFICVWQKEIICNVDEKLRSAGSLKVEKLFTLAL